jgi:hypothetical protein
MASFWRTSPEVVKRSQHHKERALGKANAIGTSLILGLVRMLLQVQRIERWVTLAMERWSFRREGPSPLGDEDFLPIRFNIPEKNGKRLG